MAEHEELLDVKEVAEILGIPEKRVYELNKAGVIKFLKIGSYKCRRSTLDKFIAKIEGMDYTDPYNPKPLEVSG